MLRKLHIFKPHITMGFLVSLSCVFICDFLCDLGVIEFQKFHVYNHKSEILSTPEIHNHSHSSQAGFHDLSNEQDENQGQNHGHDHSNHSNNQDEENCCDDLSNAVYSTLIKSDGITINVEVKLHALYLIENGVHSVSSSLSWYKKVSFLYDIPPPPGKVIRILFQSFLN